MNKKIISRVNVLADYIIKTKSTIREIAKKYGISKSTVHKDLTERLKEIDFARYQEVEKIFQKHLEIRHIKGGESTKNKYLMIKET
ncbi:MAG: sporulation transcriptional regulator SpoIIID [bacterium]|nr:sporulation transcriptional regulator SpoIIID [bacterium]